MKRLQGTRTCSHNERPGTVAKTRAELGLDDGGYALVTLHRPLNVDDQASLQPIVESLVELSEDIPIVFVAHPRTIKKSRPV